MLTVFFTIYCPLSIIYLETVFMLSTGIPFSVSNLIGIFISSICYGGLFFLLSSLFKNKNINRALRAAFLFLESLLFLLLYFIFAEFGVVYSFGTMANGASGAVSDYSYNIRILLLSPSGILHFAIFLFPFILYLILMKKDEARRLRPKWIAVSASLVVLLFLTHRLYISANDVMNHSYTDEYEFDRAVRILGVNTAARLDVREAIPLFTTSEPEDTTAGFVLPEDTKETSSNAAATVTPAPAASASGTGVSSDTAESEIPEEIVYTPNVLDIDFEALAETTSGNLQAMDLYVASLTPSMKNQYTGLFEGKNLILITAEAFSAEVIDEELTPTLYRLATKGIQFNDYYQPSGAGTTGGEYNILMGMLPTDGGSSMTDTRDNLNYMTMGYQLNRLGYYGKMYHNGSYTYYNRNATHINLGYSDGFMANGNGLEKMLDHAWSLSDKDMFEATLPTYIDKQPFNIYYMTVSGHCPYSFDGNGMSKKHKDEVADLEYSSQVRAYIACQLEFEAAMEYLVDTLEEKGIADDTVIVISADHFPYGLSYGSSLPELYGEKVKNNLVRDHNRLIIWCGELEDMDPIIVDDPVFSPDITPTLLNLFGVEFDSRLMVGRDVLSDADPLVFNLSHDWKTDLGTYIASSGKFTPVSEDTVIPEGYEDQIKTIVNNKINFCRKCLSGDYYRHVFPDAESSKSAVTYGRTNYVAPTEEPAEEQVMDIPLPTEAVIPDETQLPDGTQIPDEQQTDLPPAADSAEAPVDSMPVPAPSENQEAAE